MKRRSIQLSEKNYILDELKGDKEKISKQETKLFKELLEFEKKNKKELLPEKKRVIDFPDIVTDESYPKKTSLKFAAESNDIEIKNPTRKASFLLSDDGKYALKYSRKNKDEFNITVLTDSEVDTTDIILYSQKLDKYFVPVTKGGFVISQYASLDLSYFNFKAILPYDKIIIIKKNKSFSVLSYYNFSKPEIIKTTESFLQLKINSEKSLSTAALYSEKTRDLVNLKNSIIEIPKILLTEKSLLFIY